MEDSIQIGLIRLILRLIRRNLRSTLDDDLCESLLRRLEESDAKRADLMTKTETIRELSLKSLKPAYLHRVILLLAASESEKEMLINLAIESSVAEYIWTPSVHWVESGITYTDTALIGVCCAGRADLVAKIFTAITALTDANERQKERGRWVRILHRLCTGDILDEMFQRSSSEAAQVISDILPLCQKMSVWLESTN